jgi:ferredoxin--NADP+ reductase
MDPQQRWLKARVTGRRQWTDTLFSLYVDADPIDFQAGQFVKLALASESGGELLGRPYSFVNAPHQRPHEFYCVIVPGGPLSPRLARLQAGDLIYLASHSSGFLVLSEVPAAKTLWLISTGTGVGPFLSILRTDVPWRRFEKVVLVQGIRYLADRSHQDVMANLAALHPTQFRSVSLVSRDSVPEHEPFILTGRIPAALNAGSIERVAGLSLDAQTSHVMLCGNPAMIAETIEVLKTRGMRKHRRRMPGHITVENYW